MVTHSKIIQTHLTPCAVQIKWGGGKGNQSLWVINCQHRDKTSPWCQWTNQGRKGCYLGHWLVLAFPISITWSLFAKPVLPLLSDSSSPCFHDFIFLLPYLRHLDPFLNPPAQKPDTFSKQIKHCLEETFLLPLQLQQCIQPLQLMFFFLLLLLLLKESLLPRKTIKHRG